MEMHVCKYCGKTFETGNKLGAHVIGCKYNPKYREIREKIIITKTKLRKDFIIKCPVCRNKFVVKCTINDYKKGRYKRTCSQECAHKLSVINTNLDNKNKKISKTNIDKYTNIKKEPKYRTCACCGRLFEVYNNSKYCSKECLNKSRHEKLSQIAKTRNLGGLNPSTTHKYYKKGLFDGIQCDSSWELAFLIYCKDHNIVVERNIKPLYYIFEGKQCKFYPDFIVNNELVEIKGYFDKRNIEKKKQNPQVRFIDKNGIKKYMNYTISIYGEDFIKMYNQ